MNKIVYFLNLFQYLFIFYFLTLFITNYLLADNDSDKIPYEIEQSLIKVFKRSMTHWDIDYDALPENRSGAACIPWKKINKEFLKDEIFIALGYGFNLYDEPVAKKAAIEGCNRMRKYHKLQTFCNCEMVLYNNESRIQVPKNVQ